MIERHPPNRNQWRSRKEIAALLTAAEFPIAVNTLKMMAHYKSGPPYRLYGQSRKTYYNVGSALEWAKAHWANKTAAPKRR
jgi:hypothetical protein